MNSAPVDTPWLSIWYAEPVAPSAVKAIIPSMQ
jgi:hypothetical protein